MSQFKTLVEELEQFIYQYAPQMLHKRILLAIVQNWEKAYKDRIAELENQVHMNALNVVLESRPQEPIETAETKPHRMWPEDDTENQF